jgi:glucose-1-phosphate thymidylyltransferase
MKGVILAGGTGSRLFPLTKVINKHLLPVGKYPMICYPIERLKKAGITEIMITAGRGQIGQIIEFLGSGIDFGLNFTFKVQEKAGGIAEALLLAEDFAKNEKITVILGDNIFTADLSPYISDFDQQPHGAKILLKSVPDPCNYGIVEIKDGKIVGIEEKPESPKSNLCVTGIYMYDSRVFDIIKELKPSARKELEITDVNNTYQKKGSLSFDILNGWWLDAGTFSSFAAANQYTADLQLNIWNKA